MKAVIHPFSLALSTPFETAAGTITRREGFVLELQTESSVGYGEATPLPGWTESFRACELRLEAATAALEADDPAGARDACADHPAARHAVDLAILDARSRRADRPLHRYLGATDTVEAVPVCATIDDAPAEATVAAATTATDAGYSCLKLKVGARTPDADARRVRRVHEATPGDTIVRVDANGAWSSDAAHGFLDALGSVAPPLLEQPMASTDLSGHAALRDTGAPVALDEAVVEHGLEAIVAADAADAVVLKPMAIGGIERSHQAAQTALDQGVTPILSTTFDAALARTAASHIAATLPAPTPAGLATGDRLVTDLVDESPRVHDGVLDVPEGNGNGLAPTTPDDA
ncbi:MAG: o-succinylbenzoate synthase [Halobacteriaceae archaeon]